MTSTSVEITRSAGFRVLIGLLIAVSLLNLAGCLAVTPDDRDAGGRRNPLLDVPQRAVPNRFSSNPELPSLDLNRLPLHAALVVPDFVQATISELVVPTCSLFFDINQKLEFPVGELASNVAQEMLSQLFASADRVNDQADVRGNYDVAVEMTSLVVQMQSDCPGGERDLKVRLSLGGKITDPEGQTLLGEASFEKKMSGHLDDSNVGTIRSALEHALVETMAGWVRRLATKPKLLEYARAFQAPQDAPSSRAPVTPSPLITAPPIY